MKLHELPAGESIFLDANLLVYHFAAHPIHGLACTDFIDLVTRGEFTAVTSTHILSETAHQLMTYEAARQFGWKSKIVDHLKRQPHKI